MRTSDRMTRWIVSVLGSIRAALAIPRRARWSFIDQALISGVNVLTAILLVRTLGLQDFGVFSLTLIGIQFLAGLQAAIILQPMMSLFDQRRQVSQSSYLAAMLLHQVAVAALAVALLVLASFIPRVSTTVPIDTGLAAAVLVTTQFQDLARRFFYVTDRPLRAFASDAIAYGTRIAIMATLALYAQLTIDRVWIVIASTSVAALLVLVPDLRQCRPSWPEIKEITRRHRGIASWLLGNAIIGWFSASDFILMIVGSVFGAAQLGGVRAVQNLVNLANLLLQALENFVPSAATKALATGGGVSLLRYVGRVSILGMAVVLAATVLLMSFANPILLIMYGQTFPHQVAIIALLGTFAALGYLVMVVYAGLRALQFMRYAVMAEAAVAVPSLGTAWSIATEWGVVGSLTGLLVARITVASLLIIVLRRKAKAISGEADSRAQIVNSE